MLTSAHPPHSSQPARDRSVRGAWRVSQSPATRPASASGMSHAICVPLASLNNRSQPDAPPKPMLAPPPGEPAPVPRPGPSPPKTRDKPLYPRTRLTMELSVVLPMYGRADAGHNATIATHQLLATIRVAAAAA